MYKRIVSKTIKKWLSGDEIIILYGARQVGKTTLLENLVKTKENAIIYNCELNTIAEILESKNLTQIKLLLENYKIVIFDEAQTIKNIGSVLKLIYDDKSIDTKIIVTGSSSFKLANKVVEPLTGRNVKFKLYPLSLKEISEKHNWLWLKENLAQLLIYGSYPGIIDLPKDKKTIKLAQLSSDYLYQDVLSYQDIRNPQLLRKLLKALALQVGSQVSYNELSNLLKVSAKTVEKYIDLLEKSFVIYSLPTFSKNLRNEIKKSRKFFFYDLGIRNAILNNYNTLDNRNDIGMLWENFCINEIIKNNEYNNEQSEFYFWRTYDGAEIDLIKIKNDKIYAYEFKWNPNSRFKFAKSFVESYKPEKKIKIDTSNFKELYNLN
jgi:predicted AAA+ superfamily ATPase